MRLQLYGHAGGHLRDALLDAIEKDRVRWWTHVRIDFDSERHHAWWNRLSDHGSEPPAMIFMRLTISKSGFS